MILYPGAGELVLGPCLWLNPKGITGEPHTTQITYNFKLSTDTRLSQNNLVKHLRLTIPNSQFLKLTPRALTQAHTQSHINTHTPELSSGPFNSLNHTSYSVQSYLSGTSHSSTHPTDAYINHHIETKLSVFTL